MHCMIYALDKENVHKITVLKLTGRFLGKVDGPSFIREVEALLAAGMHHFILDMKDAEGMDSTAIGVLIRCLKKTRKSGGDLRLASLNERMGRLFSMARLLETVFWNFPSVGDAVQSFSSLPDKRKFVL